MVDLETLMGKASDGEKDLVNTHLLASPGSANDSTANGHLRFP